MLKKIVDGVEVTMSVEEESEIKSEWAANDATKQEYEATLEYRDKRKTEYPPIGDQIDLIYKMAKHLKANGTALGADGDELILLLDAVKANNPKPV